MLRDLHGGLTYKRDIKLDFSANVNPLGMPESVRRAAKEAVDISDRYPVPDCGELKERLAEIWGVRRDMIAFGNGADDLIYRIAFGLKPKCAVIVTPTFSEYANALAAADCRATEHRLREDNGFALDETVLGKLTDGIDMLVLCSPNNPTGRLIKPGLLKRTVQECERHGIYLLLDECFIELAENGDSHRLKPEDLGAHLIILRAFTKTYAMPGLRLGYAVFGSADTFYKVSGCGQYWSASAPAQAAGIAALGETQYVETARKLIAEERKYLTESLVTKGFKVYPSDANFLLFRSELPLDEMLFREGILIRNCANYSGLGQGFFRIAVRTHDENEALVAAIDKIK